MQAGTHFSVFETNVNPATKVTIVTLSFVSVLSKFCKQKQCWRSAVPPLKPA
jgi:hypothetical protein